MSASDRTRVVSDLSDALDPVQTKKIRKHARGIATCQGKS